MEAIRHLIPLHPQCRVFCTASCSYDNIPYPHYHDACELTVILSGRHLIELENEKLELTAGDVLLLNADIAHSRCLSMPGKHVTIAFESTELERLEAYLELDWLAGKDEWKSHLSTTEVDAVVDAIERINLYATVNPERVKGELRGLLIRLWQRANGNLHAENLHQAPWIIRLSQCMKEPEKLRRGVAALLELTPYSHAYVCREFKRLWGCTPTEYVNSLRLDYAHQLLENTRMGIADICYEVGMESISYFYRLFRSKYGMSPARYRKLRFIAKPNLPLEQRTESAEKNGK